MIRLTDKEKETNHHENEQEKDIYEDNIIDEDLYEEFEDEELYALVQEAREKALERARIREEEKKSYRKLPRTFYWLIALFLMMNVLAFLPQTISIPAVEFIKTSAKLSKQANIKTYKKSVVVIETDDGSGTGFSINEQGDILTNYHVIEGYHKVTVAFPEKGLHVGEVVETYPEIDLALLRLEGDDTFPYLPLAEEFVLHEEEHIYFIGNPLRFTGIANEGKVLDYISVKKKPLPVVMMDAPVYRGNSGSPVINEDGLVIGVVYATLDHDEAGRVGLFIPIDYFDMYRK